VRPLPIVYCLYVTDKEMALTTNATSSYILKMKIYGPWQHPDCLPLLLLRHLKEKEKIQSRCIDTPHHQCEMMIKVRYCVVIVPDGKLII
jgi:hypothetical protein